MKIQYYKKIRWGLAPLAPWFLQSQHLPANSEENDQDLSHDSGFPSEIRP
jgi:hypothetical protein